ncbi:MAG: inorganic phosphate transporter family protein [Phycisphaerae bacterium]|nr:inorganic phosphate transporter family protein [Phycisphaerae bacterium]
MFLAINMGGSGTAPSFSAAYGSNIIKKNLIPGIFGIFVFLGAIIAGENVAKTIGGSIVPREAMTLTLGTIILLSVSLSLLIANLLKVPQSTSQATITALVGPAIYYKIIQIDKLFFEIIPAWFILPIIAFAITFLIGKFLYNPLNKRQIVDFKEISAHPLLKILALFASCYVAFAIGSNNVANASGPIASIVSNELNIKPENSNFLLVMILATLVTAPCFAIGSSIFGKGVSKTVGKEIIQFSPLGASLISIVTASLLIFASLSRGIPTSLVQMNALAVMGLGVSKVGWKRILTNTSIKKLLVIWIISPIISFTLSFTLTVIADRIGL